MPTSRTKRTPITTSWNKRSGVVTDWNKNRQIREIPTYLIWDKNQRDSWIIRDTNERTSNIIVEGINTSIRTKRVPI